VAAKAPLAWIASRSWLNSLMQTSTNGGVSETRLKALTVMPW
jgi:hypothetical protein